MPGVQNEPIKIFASYKNITYDSKILGKIKTFLDPIKEEGKIIIWDDSALRAGDQLHEIIRDQIESADIFLLLLSSDYLASDYIKKNELPRIFEREEEGTCRIIPILVRHCTWEKFSAISEKAIIPKKKDKPLQPIKSWSDPESALKMVTDGIDEIIKDAAYFKQKYPQNKAVISQNKTTNSKNIWEGIPLKKELEKIEFFNLDRENEFSNCLLTDFDENVNLDRNLFYFITSCRTQVPSDLAKRLIHSAPDVFTEYTRVSDEFDSIRIHRLKIKRNPELTWTSFWEYFVNQVIPEEWSKSLPQEEKQDAVFSVFLKEAIAYLQLYKRYPIFFVLDSNEWKNAPKLAVEEHMKVIIDKFSALPVGAHKFVFFFLIEIADLHKHYSKKQHEVVLKLNRIEKLCTYQFQSKISPHVFVVKLLKHVLEKDLKDWLGGLIDWDRTGGKTLDDYFDSMIALFLEELNEMELKLYKSKKAFNMDRLVSLQRRAYEYLR